MDTEPPWKQVKLSLERPYKDDHGSHIPAVEDITPEGEYIYETKENPSARLELNLRRIFQERGPDFFDRISSGNTFISDGSQSPDDTLNAAGATIKETDGKDEDEPKVMTPEDLREMREEILKNLAVSLGEMTLAQQVLAALLVTPNTEPQSQLKIQSQLQSHSPAQLQSQPSSQSQPDSLTSNINFSGTLVTKPPPITSLQAFNAQLTIGGKDEALRHAAGLFKASAESMERTRLAGEKYWVDALKIRRNNWGLVPAPLPLGSATGKGADKTSKDFLISYGLEESPAQFRRRAIGRLATYSGASFDMIFPHRRMTRLHVSITTRNETGATWTTSNTIPLDDEKNLNGALRAAQREIVEQEIFSILVQEAGTLPTASARVSERLIVIDAAQGLELQIELVDDIDSLAQEGPFSGDRSDMCDLIYHGLHILLLRRHAQLKAERLDPAGPATVPVVVPQAQTLSDNKSNSKHPVLQPIIDLLQYQVFLHRVQKEVVQVFQAMQTAGIPATLLVNSVGATGKELIRLLDPGSSLTVGGEIVFRVYDRHTIRLTFVSPSTLVAHLSQSTLTISSVPQLCQLLMDEVEQCLLKRVCDLGKSLSESISGTWFIDLDRCVGRWEGCVLNFRVTYGTNYLIHCTAYFLGRSTGKQGKSYRYPPRDYGETKFLEWAEYLIENAVRQANIGL